MSRSPTTPDEAGERGGAPPNDRNEFFPEVIRIMGFGAAFASIPLLARLGNLQPPWPPAVAYISAAVILVGMLIVREYGAGMSRRRRRLLLIIAGTLSVIGLFTYLYLYLRLIVPLPTGERLTLGFACNADTLAMYADRCPYLGMDEISAAGFDLELLYTTSSLQAAKLWLVAAWMVFTTGLVAAVGWAVVRGDRTPEPPAFE